MKKKNKASTQLTTILHNKKAKELVTIICDDKDKYLIKDKTEAILNKNVSIKCIPISNTSEDEKELTLLKNKKKKQRKEDKKEVQNNENLKTDEIILKTGKLYTETFNDHDKDLNKERTRDSNSNKDEWTRKIPIANTSEGDSLFKKKKKKTNGDKKMVQNDEDSTNDKATLKVDKFHDETLHDNYKHLDKDEIKDSNLNKDEWTRKIPIANTSEGDSLFKKKKKKKNGDKQMVQNDKYSTHSKASVNVEKFYDLTLHDNTKHLDKDEINDSNLNKDEWTIRNPIGNASENGSLFKKKKKKKNGDKQMVQNDEDLTHSKASMNVEKFYDLTLHDNYKHLDKDQIKDSNLNKDEWTIKNPIGNASENGSLFKKKKKKKKEDKKMVQNDEGSINNKAALNVDKFYDETSHGNYQHLNIDETRDSNLNKCEWTRKIPIANTSEGDSLFKKKKKKKKGDKQMVQNYEDSTHSKASMNVEKFYDESFHTNYQQLNKDKTRDYNLNKDEWTRRIPISDASEDSSLFKKKKKKKKEDKKMVQNDEYSSNNKGALKVEKFYDLTLHENYKHLDKDEIKDSNLNKYEWTRRIPISDASEDGSLFKKKKKKKKDNKMVQNDEDSTHSKASMNVEKFYDESFHTNYQQLNKDKARDSNLNKDEWTRRNPIFDASENGSLVKKKKKKKKGDKQMVLNNEDSKNDKITLKVEKFYNDTLDDNDKHLNKDESRNSHLNKDECTRRIPVANALDGDSLLKSPSKNTKKKKKKSKMAIKEDTELSKHELIQKFFKNMEYLNKNVSEEQSNDIHYDFKNYRKKKRKIRKHLLRL